jgi:hypothetical protein
MKKVDISQYAGFFERIQKRVNGPAAPGIPEKNACKPTGPGFYAECEIITQAGINKRR